MGVTEKKSSGPSIGIRKADYQDIMRHVPLVAVAKILESYSTDYVYAHCTGPSRFAVSNEAAGWKGPRVLKDTNRPGSTGRVGTGSGGESEPSHTLSRNLFEAVPPSGVSPQTRVHPTPTPQLSFIIKLSEVAQGQSGEGRVAACALLEPAPEPGAEPDGRRSDSYSNRSGPDEPESCRPRAAVGRRFAGWA